APICTLAELLTTPCNGFQVTGAVRLETLSSVNPVADASHEIVKLAPARLTPSRGGGGGALMAAAPMDAAGMPSASGPPSAATSSSLIRPSRTWIALTYASEFSLSESPNRTISGRDNAKLESTCPRSPLIWSRFLIPSIYLARIGGLAARSTANATRLHSLRACLWPGAT